MTATDPAQAAATKANADGRPDEGPGLDYPCGTAPEAGEAKEIAPGVLWARMPLPWQLSHINVYAIRDGDGWAMVDTGAQTPPGLAAWRKLLGVEGASGALAGQRLTRVFATHMHPDHMGMAGWLTRRFDCRLWITRLEYLTCRTLMADTGREAPAEAIRFYTQLGWPEESLDTYRARFGSFGKVVHALPDSFRRLTDGERFTIGEHEWQVVVGHGHSPEHACLYCPALKLLISGDQVLPRISSNVSVHPTEPEANPLADWMESLDKLRTQLPGDLLVLPAHGEPFRGLHQRLDRLSGGHARSLDRLRKSLAEPKRVMEVFPALFARQIEATNEMLHLATGESLAHLNYLMSLGEVQRALADDGVYRYRMT
jgi:glyoxylase-like metal-dependent hydrolase (beta-lactamase superfamily II)